MFRQGLRRCAVAASRNTSSTPILRSGQRFLSISTLPSPISRVAFVPKSFANVSRFYSSEASAVEAEASTEAGNEVFTTAEDSVPDDSFAGLERFGVHRNLLKSITGNMGYENMTPVQSKTIQPALKGTDM